MPLELGKTFKETFYSSVDTIRNTSAKISPDLDYAMNKAETVSTKEFDIESQYQGEGDALRHILTSAIVTNKWGTKTPAKILSWLNENVKGTLQGATEEDRDMDLTNDTIGREIGLKAKSEEEIFKLAKEAVQSGKAKVLKKTPKEGETTEEMEARIEFEKEKAELDK